MKIGVILVHLPVEVAIHTARAMAHLQQHSLWEVRHSGFLGLKYLVAVRPDAVPALMAETFPSVHPKKTQPETFLSIVLQGLKDSSDDVRLVAADTLHPTVKLIVQNCKNMLVTILNILWETLLVCY